MIKRVAVINDLSSLGKCSLTAAIPVLSVMGVQPCPVPTAILTNQTEYNSYYCYDFTDKIDNYIEQWQKLGITFDGIYTGYLNSADQIKKILHFCETFRDEKTLLIVDPVMGDSGFVYDMLGLPRELFTPLFAMARIAGWSAHRIEELINAGKIIRPAYMAVQPHRDYKMMSER